MLPRDGISECSGLQHSDLRSPTDQPSDHLGSDGHPPAKHPIPLRDRAGKPDSCPDTWFATSTGSVTAESPSRASRCCAAAAARPRLSRSAATAAPCAPPAAAAPCRPGPRISWTACCPKSPSDSGSSASRGLAATCSPPGPSSAVDGLVCACGGRRVLHVIVLPPATLYVLDSLRRSANRNARAPPMAAVHTS